MEMAKKAGKVASPEKGKSPIRSSPNRFAVLADHSQEVESPNLVGKKPRSVSKPARLRGSKVRWC